MHTFSMRVTRYGLLALFLTAFSMSATTFDFSTGNDFGFANGSNTNGSWAFTSNSWQLTYDNNSDVSLLSPILTASGGAVTLQFTHSRNFESTFDGGIVELALNGGGFSKITAFTQNGYDQSIGLSGLAGPVFSDSFSSQTSIADLGTLAAGDSLQLRWHSGSDGSEFPAAPNWVLTSVDVSGLAVSDGPSAPSGIPEPATLSLAAIAFAGMSLLWKYNARQR